jgi:CRISPR-associated protein Cas8a1/Csx13
MPATGIGTKRTETGGTLRIGLFDPGMTPLHRAGLAGLWMTLAALDERPEESETRERLQSLGGSWERARDAVTFTWSGEGKAFFSELIRQSFRLTEDGRFWFLGLGHPDGHKDGGTVLQAAVLETFLQHGMTREADKPEKPSGRLVLEIDGAWVRFSYRKVGRYIHQKSGDEFRLTKPSPVRTWLAPGGGVRHQAFGSQTELVEAPGLWLALLYAPVGSIYFRVRSFGRGVRPQFCLAVPDLDDLERYARMRRLFLSSPVQDLVVAGVADAGLRVLAELEAERLIATGVAARCHVFAFGVAPWARQQRTRVDRYVVEGVGGKELRMFRNAVHLLPTLAARPLPNERPEEAEGPSQGSVGGGSRRSRRGATGGRGDAAGPEGDSGEDGGELNWEVSPLLDLVARNVAAGRPWWNGVTSLIRAPDTWAQWRRYDRALAMRRRRSDLKSAPGGVAAMVSQPDAFTTAEEAIVEACQEAWRRRLGALSERARTRGERFQDLVERERERLRIAFAHCKNAESLRAALIDFWSRAGTIPTLRERWREVLPYLGPERWQLTRDLALLALVSYAAQEENREASNGADRAEELPEGS